MCEVRRRGGGRCWAVSALVRQWSGGIPAGDRRAEAGEHIAGKPGLGGGGSIALPADDAAGALSGDGLGTGCGNGPAPVPDGAVGAGLDSVAGDLVRSIPIEFVGLKIIVDMI